MSILPPPASSSSQSAPIVLTWTSRWGIYSPGRGIGYSILIHAVVLTVVVQLLSASRASSEFDPWDTSEGEEVQMVMYLPSIGGGGQSGTGGAELPGDDAPEEPSPGSEGLVYPGPQLIRSDSSDPTSTVQTLLQPELEDPPVLEEVVDLPNFISTPELGTVQRVESSDPPPDLPDLIEEPEFVEPPVPEPPPEPESPPEPEPEEPEPSRLMELPILERSSEMDLLKTAEAGAGPGAHRTDRVSWRAGRTRTWAGRSGNLGAGGAHRQRAGRSLLRQVERRRCDVSSTQ